MINNLYNSAILSFFRRIILLKSYSKNLHYWLCFKFRKNSQILTLLNYIQYSEYTATNA